ncbi:MAG: hypothetical protein ACLFV3_12670 [Phycisphaeraceae bacterium]
MSKSKTSPAVRAARASLCLPLLLLALSFIVGQSRALYPPMLQRVYPFAIAAVSLAAFGLAVYALGATRRPGGRGVMGYSVAGLITNGVILGGFGVVLGVAVLRGPASASAQSVGLIPAPGTIPDDARLLPDRDHWREVRLDRLGCRFEIPPSYKRSAALPGPSFECAFVSTEVDLPELSIAVQRLGGVVPSGGWTDERRKAWRASLPPGAEAETFRTPWQGDMVNATRLVTRQPGGKVVDYGVMIPLTPEAIIVHVTGPVEAEQRVRQTASLVLASLYGPSNWD